MAGDDPIKSMVKAAGKGVVKNPQKKEDSLSDEDLLAMFGEPEKKKTSPDTSEDSPGLPPPPEEKKSTLGSSYLPELAESGTGSTSQSGEWEGSTGRLGEDPLTRMKREAQGDWEGDVGHLSDDPYNRGLQIKEKEEKENLKKLDNGITRLHSALAVFNQRVVDLPAQVLESSAILGQQLDDKTYEIFGIKMGDPGQKVQDDWMYKASEKLRGWAEEAWPTNPIYQDELSHQIAHAAGDLTALVLSSGRSPLTAVTNASAKAGVTGVVKNVAQKAGNYIKNPAVMVGAIQTGTSEWEQAKASGATDEQAFEVFYKNAAVGSVLESIPVMHYFKRLDKVTGGGVKRALTAGATQGLEEMVTEVAQQYYSNTVAADTYDATRKWYDGMVESGGIGFGLGFVLGAMGTSLRKKYNATNDPAEKAEIMKAINYVDDKQTDFASGKLTDQGTEGEKKFSPEEAQKEQVIPGALNEQTVVEEQTPQEMVSESIAGEESVNPVEETTTQTEEITPTEDTIDTTAEVVNENNPPAIEEAQIIPEENQVEPQTITENESTKQQQSGELQQQIQPTQEGESKNEVKQLLRPTKIKVGNTEYRVRTKEGQLQIKNNSTGEILSNDSKKAKRILDKYKDKNIQRFASGETVDLAQSWLDDTENRPEINEKFKAITGFDIDQDYADRLVNYDTKYGEVKNKPADFTPENLAQDIKDGKDVSEYRSMFNSDQDFELATEYLKETQHEEQGQGPNESSQDSEINATDKRISTEGPEVEETKGAGGETGGFVGTIRDKVRLVEQTDSPEERNKIIEETVNDIDTYVAENKDILSESGAQEKERSFAKQIKNSKDLPPEIKKGLSKEGRKYIPITNKLTAKEASALVDIKGVEQSTKDYLNKNNGMHPAVRTMMGEMLIKKHNQLASETTDTKTKNKHLDEAINVANDLSIHLTSLGQAIQAAAVFAKLSPEGVIRYISSEFKKTRDKKMEKLRPDIDSTETAMNEINSEVAEEVIKNLTNDITVSSIKKNEKKRKKTVKEAVDFLDKLKIKTKPGNFNEASIFAIPIATWNTAITTMQYSLQAGDMVATAIEKAVKYIKSSHKGQWDELGFRKDMAEKLSSLDQQINPKLITENAIKDSDLNISELVKKHYSEVDEAKKSLTDKLVSESGLQEQDAKDLAKQIEKEFDKIATKKKRDFLNKKISNLAKSLQPKQARKKQQLHEKIIEMTNQRVLTSREFDELYAEAFDLPKLTPEQTAKLTDLANKVQTAKGAEAHSKAVQDLLKYQASLQGFSLGEVGMAIWYANILSGLSTQTMNVYANFAETAGEAYVSMVQDPKKAPALMRGLFQGYGKGLLLAKDVLQTGYSPVKDSKIDVQNILERYNLPGPFRIYNYLKYVQRLMSAADIFAYSGLKEMRSQQLAMSIALKEGKDQPTKEIEKKANEILYNTQERVAEATIRATKEGLTGDAKKRRIYELIEESRPEALNEDAKDFASEGTFNYDPVGWIGAGAQKMSNITNDFQVKEGPLKGVRPLSFIVPFTRIIANVLNRYLDWTPWGLVRAAKGGQGLSAGNRFAKRYTPEERQREAIKAITGTAAMAALMAMTTPDEEGESEIEITADGTGDFKKNYELQETGWRPYSVKIGDKWYEYKNTPLALPFALVGQIRDAQKYQGKDSPSDQATIAATGMLHYILDMSFLQGLSDFFSVFSKSHQDAGAWMEQAAKSTSRTAKSFVVPNLYTQTSRTIQELNGMPMKQAKTITEELIRDTPILRDDLNNMYNALGEPVVADQNRKYIPFKVKSDESDKVWDLIADNQAWVGMPSKNTVVYDPKLDGERKLTDEEYNKFAILAGQMTKKAILENYNELKKMSKAEVRDAIEDYKKYARKEAKYDAIVK